MNSRQLFQRIMNYEPVDRMPVLSIEPYETATLQRWQSEGLPPDQSPEAFLHMDEFYRLPIKFGPVPEFATQVIAEDQEYIVTIDPLGTTTKRRKEAPQMYYGHIDFPVKTRQDWQNYKQRFQADLQSRVFQDYPLDDLIQQCEMSEKPVYLCLFPFYFRLGFYMMGMERLMTLFYDDPEFIHEMFSYWTDFVCSLVEPVLSRVQVDFVTFGEDLAYKTSTHISPDIYEAFWYPYQDKVVNILQKHNVPTVALWSAGNLHPLLPGLLEHGINCICPLERGADDMDPRLLRKKYGKKLRLIGGIAKETLIAGPSAIDDQIDYLLPLMREGGYIPALDDMPPPEVPFSHFRYLIKKLREIQL